MFSKQNTNLVANFGRPIIKVDINSPIIDFASSYLEIVTQN